MIDSIEVRTRKEACIQGIESQLQEFENGIRDVNKYHPTVVVLMKINLGQGTQGPTSRCFWFLGENKLGWSEALQQDSMLAAGFFTHTIINNRVQHIVKAIDYKLRWMILPADSRDGKGITKREFFEKILEEQAATLIELDERDRNSSDRAI
jgi:hypothetical protein